MWLSVLALLTILAAQTEAGTRASGWADTSRPFRVKITVPGEAGAAARACASIPLDLGSDLARLGLASQVAPSSLRLVESRLGETAPRDVPFAIRDGRVVWPLPLDGCRTFELFFDARVSASTTHPSLAAAEIQIPDYATDAYGKGWDFDRGDFEAIDVWGDRPQNIRSRKVVSGILQLDVTGDSYFIWGDMWNSPQHSQRPVSIDLNRYPVLEMRVRQSVPDAEWGLYGRPGRSESLLHYGFRVSGTDWQTVRIDLRRQARWHGILTAFRIDPAKNVNARVEFDWVRLLSLVEANRAAMEVLGPSRSGLRTAFRALDPRPRAGSEQQVTIVIRDSEGRPARGQPVLLSLASGAGGAILPAERHSGLATPDGVRAITDAGGEAVFVYRASRIAKPGSDRLVAMAEFTEASPVRQAVTTMPGPPTRYVVTPDMPRILQPGGPPLKVTARLADSFGNPLPGRRMFVWSAPGARLLRADSRSAPNGSAIAVARGDPARSWVWAVAVHDSAGLSGRSAPVCVLAPGPRRKPIRLTKSGYFEAGGRAWLPLGGFYANWVGTRTPDGEWHRLISFTDATDEQIIAWLRFLRQNGVTAERFMLRTHRPDGMEPMDIGGRVNPGLFAAFLHYLDLARPFGLRFLLVLHEDYTKPLYYDAHALERYALPWYAGQDLGRLPPYQRRFIRDRRLIEDIGDKYTDPDVIACQDAYARQIVGLLKGNPLVFGYELENEMVGCPASWVNHMAATIRSVDPTAPICVSHGGGGLFTADPAWWSANTTIDFYTPHLYPDVPVTSPDCDYGLAVDVLMRYVRQGKPAFLGESSGDQFSSHPDRQVRRWTMRDIIWFSLVNGRPGCFFWNARGSEVAEFRLANEIARIIDWTHFQRKPARLIVAVPHALPNDHWFRAGPGRVAYLNMAKYDRFSLDRGAELDFSLDSRRQGAIPLDGTRFSPPDVLPSDFGVTPGCQLAPLVRADDGEALLYIRNFAGVVRWDSPGDHTSTQYLRSRAAVPLSVTLRLPGRFTADVWDLDTGAHTQRELRPGEALDLGTTDHDFAIHLLRDTPRRNRGARRPPLALDQ